MSYVQLVQPNLNVVGEPYGCLSYAESFLGAPHIEACATDAYNNTQFKHTDPLPDNIVPVWFSWLGTVAGVYKDWGHVAVYVPGQGFYSSPYNLPGHKLSASTAEIEQALGAKYLGWSEDISTLRVVKGVSMIEPQTIISTFADFHAGVPTQDQINYYGNHPNGYDELHTDMAKYNLDARLAAEKQVADLTAANQKLVDQLQALKAVPVVAPATPAPVTPTDSVTITKDSLWARFVKFWIG